MKFLFVCILVALAWAIGDTINCWGGYKRTGNRIKVYGSELPEILVVQYRRRLFLWYLKCFFLGKLPYWIFKHFKFQESPKPPFHSEEFFDHGKMLRDYLMLNFSAKFKRQVEEWWEEQVRLAVKYGTEQNTGKS